MNTKAVVIAIISIFLVVGGILIFRQKSHAPNSMLPVQNDDRNNANPIDESTASQDPYQLIVDNIQTTSFDNIQFSITDDFGLATSKDQIPANGSIPPCDEDFNYCLYYKANKYEGTNFDSAGIRIKKRNDLNSKYACMSTQPTGYEGLSPTIKDSDQYMTIIFDNLGDSGAGHLVAGKLYRIFDGTDCYEFQTRIAQNNFSNYEEGSIKEFTAQDNEMLEKTLDLTVRSNVKLKNAPEEDLFGPPSEGY